MRKILGVSAAAIVLVNCATLDTGYRAEFALAPGDLLFQDLDCGPMCEAIETVTEGVDGANFSHVGMVSRVTRDRVWVVEAVGAGVVMTDLERFLARSADEHGRPKVLVGRLQPPNDALIADAIIAAEHYLGFPYDRIYELTNAAFYCSELLHEAFLQANGGAPIFDTPPMTYNDPATGEPFSVWVDYFDELGVPIPEGEPGLNPGGMSRSPVLSIVHAYGKPDGWQDDR